MSACSTFHRIIDTCCGAPIGPGTSVTRAVVRDLETGEEIDDGLDRPELRLGLGVRQPDLLLRHDRTMPTGRSRSGATSSGNRYPRMF